MQKTCLASQILINSMYKTNFCYLTSVRDILLYELILILIDNFLVANLKNMLRIT